MLRWAANLLREAVVLVLILGDEALDSDSVALCALSLGILVYIVAMFH